MLVDDHDMVRRGLAAFLDIQLDLQLVGEANNGRKALEMCKLLHPDVILMDLVMPEMDGMETIQAIRRKWPHIQIIALTSFQEKDLVHQALRAGAISYLLKNVTVDELAEAIRAAVNGRATISPEATQALIQTACQPTMPEYDLTTREVEVLHLLVEGLSNPQIATRLSVSRSTARAHVSNILAKLDVCNRTEAISMAFRQNLVR
ncbi:MAG: response regulator transcription factor [Chloroflexi bacterium]|nr:response regulator transcription factor [Chloroflexota bacterium]